MSVLRSAWRAFSRFNAVIFAVRSRLTAFLRMLVSALLRDEEDERLFLRELMAAEEKPEIILPLGRLSGHLSSGF